jgi:hypothetical protein
MRRLMRRKGREPATGRYDCTLVNQQSFSYPADGGVVILLQHRRIGWVVGLAPLSWQFLCFLISIQFRGVVAQKG